MEIGELLMRWSVRLAIAAYFAAAAFRMRGQVGDAAARWCWTLGFAMFVAHVLLAFGVVHGWRHAAAYEETARQTKALFGLDWGGGIWFNYAFILIWGLDSAIWWLAGLDSYRRRAAWFEGALHAWFLFMIINGAVIFAQGPVRWLTLLALVLLASGWLKWGFRGGRNGDFGVEKKAE